MARFLPFTLIAAGLGLATSAPLASAQTQTTANPGVTPASSPVLAPSSSEKAPASPAPRRPRAISAEAAAALAAATPKYTPPPPKPEPKPESEQVDLRDIDKPKNGIVRLPKYIVQEPKPPVFRERDINTQKGITDIAVRRYISDADRALNRFTLPLFGSSAESRALAMYAEDERLQNMSELRDAAIDAGRVDRAGGDYIRKEAQKTFLRSNDFGWNGGGPR